MGGVFEERSGIPIDLKLVHTCIDKCLKLQYIINGNQLPEIIVREISCISFEMRKPLGRACTLYYSSCRASVDPAVA